MSCSPHRPSSEELLAKPSASGHIWFFSARALVLDTALTSSHVIYTTWRRLWSGWFHIQLFNPVATTVRHPELFVSSFSLPIAYIYFFPVRHLFKWNQLFCCPPKKNKTKEHNGSKQAQGNYKIKKSANDFCVLMWNVFLGGFFCCYPAGRRLEKTSSQHLPPCLQLFETAYVVIYWSSSSGREDVLTGCWYTSLSIIMGRGVTF